MATIYDFTARSITGEELPLSKYRGEVLLVVNVASRCGFTPQYEGLERLYRAKREQGFEVLGFPCNQFGAQEPGSEEEIRSFCDLRFNVSFPMFAKVEVNGAGAAPLFAHLKGQRPGLLGTEAIKWNFTKFLVNRQGEVVSRHGPSTTPSQLEAEVDRLLAAPNPFAEAQPAP